MCMHAVSNERRWTYAKILVFVLILAFYATLLFSEIKLPVADDMARHVTNGKLILNGNFDVIYENVYSYTTPGHPFVNHHWFSGVIFYLLYSVLGWDGLTVLKTIVYLVAFALIFHAALRKANFWVVAVFSIPSILVLMERTSLRPEIFSYLFIALTIYLLFDLKEHPERKRIFWLIPLQLLWVNMHIFFSIGLMLVAAFLFEQVVLNYRDFWRHPLVRKAGILLIAMFAVSFINPHGATGVFYRYPPDFPAKIAENYSIIEYLTTKAPMSDLSVFLFTPLVTVLGASLLFGLWKRRVSIFLMLGSIATAALGFVILRGIVFFGFFFLLAMSSIWTPTFIHLQRELYARFPESRRVIAFISVALLIALLMYLIVPFPEKKFLAHVDLGIGLAPRSLESATFFRENSLHGPIFNDSDSGSYLVYNFYPAERVFVDNLFADGYPPWIFNEYFAILAGEDKWSEAMERYDFQTIFFYQYNGASGVRPFLSRRMRDPEWAFVYADPYNYILVRRSFENKGVIEKYHITPSNVSERLRHLSTSDDMNDKLAFADTANLLGRTDLGMAVLIEVLEKWPRNAGIWMILGEWEYEQDNPESTLLAVMYLEKAISLGQRTAEAYAYLGAAYAKAQRLEKAKEALQMALAINPDREDARELLKKIEQFEAR